MTMPHDARGRFMRNLGLCAAQENIRLWAVGIGITIDQIPRRLQRIATSLDEHGFTLSRASAWMSANGLTPFCWNPLASHLRNGI